MKRPCDCQNIHHGSFPSCDEDQEYTVEEVFEWLASRDDVTTAKMLNGTVVATYVPLALAPARIVVNCIKCGAKDIPTTGHDEVCGRLFKTITRKKDGTRFSTNGKFTVEHGPFNYHEAEGMQETQDTLWTVPTTTIIEEVTG